MINNPYDYLVMRVGHALTSKLSDTDKLNVIKISYREAFFPENPTNDRERDLIRKLYEVKDDNQ